jgi:hypothetical protein
LLLRQLGEPRARDLWVTSDLDIAAFRLQFDGLCIGLAARPEG